MRDKESSLANASSSFSFPCTPWQWSTLAHLYFIQGSIIKLFTSSCLPLPNKQSVFPKYCLVVWEVRESQQTWGSISAESHRDLQSQGKAGTDKFQFRKWAREWTLWFFGFFFFRDDTNREVWLFLWGDKSWEQDRWRTLISVIRFWETS